MGTKYQNIVVGADPRKVVGFLRYFRHTAYVAPPSADHPDVSVVCPDDGYTDEPPEPRDARPLAAELSDKLSCAALWSFCDDSDQWVYELWVNGELAGQYESPRAGKGRENDDDGSRRSPPGVVDRTSERDAMHLPDEVWDDESAADEAPCRRAELAADAAELCRAFGRPDQMTAVAAVLATTDDQDHRFADAAEYHVRLAVLLGWPPDYISKSYIGLFDARRGDIGQADAAAWTPTGDAD